MRPIVQANCFLVFGVIIGIISIAMLASFNAIYTKLLEKMLVIDPDNDIYEAYTEPSVPTYLDFYFFNVTNPDKIMTGEKPNLQEVGPYTYTEESKKIDGVFNHSAGTFKYKQATTYFFNAEKSNGSENDVITTLNPVLLLLGAELYDKDETIVNITWEILESITDLFQEHSISELLFEGYEFPDITIPWIRGYGHFSGTFYELSCIVGSCVELLEANRFGYFYGANGSNDGLYEVFTGEKSMDDYLVVKAWNGSEELDYWGYNGTHDDPYCNMINGTDGTQFPPGVEKDRLVQIFTTDLCRSIDFEFEQEIQVLEIIDTLRFIAPPEMLQSGLNYENNLCYCVPIPDQEEPCLDDAMMNMAPCLGAPLILSTPHFYEGSEEDITKVNGLNPSKDKHETYLDIEPKTGVVMRGAKRIQLNLPLKQYGSLSTFQNVPELIFPILWADENGVIPEDDANDLNDALTVPYLIIYLIFGITLAIAVIFIIIGFILRDRVKKNTKAGLLMK